MSNGAVVSYWNSTSNHNLWTTKSASEMLYLIEILHQTTTLLVASLPAVCCILLKFYIKPQLLFRCLPQFYCCILLKFYIKPQPTRLRPPWLHCCILLKFYIKPQLLFTRPAITFRCILLKFYIKPQLSIPGLFCRNGCILLKFYIKPQLAAMASLRVEVVSYWNSTSNHNQFR